MTKDSVNVCSHAWNHGRDGLPTLTQALWDKLLEIQTKRNAAVKKATDGRWDGRSYQRDLRELLSGDAYLNFVERQMGEPLSAAARRLASWPWLEEPEE